MCFVGSSSALYSAPVTAVMYTISCCVEPCYYCICSIWIIAHHFVITWYGSLWSIISMWGVLIVSGEGLWCSTLVQVMWTDIDSSPVKFWGFILGHQKGYQSLNSTWKMLDKLCLDVQIKLLYKLDIAVWCQLCLAWLNFAGDLSIKYIVDWSASTYPSICLQVKLTLH